MYSSDAGKSRHDEEFPDKPRFPGAVNSCYTEKMSFVDPEDGETIPVYRVMDRNGKVFDESQDPNVSETWAILSLNTHHELFFLHYSNVILLILIFLMRFFFVCACTYTRVGVLGAGLITRPSFLAGRGPTIMANDIKH